MSIGTIYDNKNRTAFVVCEDGKQIDINIFAGKNNSDAELKLKQYISSPIQQFSVVSVQY